MARALCKETLLSDARFVADCKALYTTDINEVAERYSALTEGMDGKIRFFSASGRAEIVGNHTDHNHGFVIASAVDMDIVAAVLPTVNDLIEIESLNFPVIKINLNDDEIRTEEFGTSMALVKGVVKGLKDHGRKVGGFKARMDSTICKGAGVSSSAAYELIVCQILNSLYNDNEIDYKEMAIISQYAENVYFGKPSGLMDQLTIAHGGVSFMDFFDPKQPEAKSLVWPFDDVRLVLINCGGDHADLTDEYAAIKTDMLGIAEYFGKKVLREVSENAFYKALPQLKKEFSGRAILRAMHFFEENGRVSYAYDALTQGDIDTFLDIVEDSGVSSYELLQNCFPSGDVSQPIPLALAIANRNEATLACRVHGGGFAGTILCFVHKEDMETYVHKMKQFFGENNVFGVSVRNVGPTEVGLED